MSLWNKFKTLSVGFISGFVITELYDRFPLKNSIEKSSMMNKISGGVMKMYSRNLFNSVKASDFKKWNWDWDKSYFDNEKLVFPDNIKLRSKYTRHLIFVRHGQYHYAHDDSNCHLTQLGLEQLNFTGVRLKNLGFPYNKVYYSTMTRAIESAELILRSLPTVPAQPDELLREGAPFIPEPAISNYNPSTDDIREDNARIEAAFRKIVHRATQDQNSDSYEIYVCHANVIRYFVCRALQLPPEAWIRFSLDHGSLTWLVVRPDGRVSLRWLGNSGHIPPERISIE